MQGMLLNDDVMRSMEPARVFKDFNSRINSIDFHRTDDLLITASDDNMLRLFNTNEGVQITEIGSQKYGATCARFTHAPTAVVHASNKGNDHALRYLDMRQKVYMRYFIGHTQRVTGISMSPKMDVMLSASQDRTVRMWDLRSDVCQGVVHMPGQPAVACDHQGLIFAISADSGVIKLYDISHYDKGPFVSFTVAELINTPAAFSHLEFSPDGKLLLAVSEGRIWVLDAYDGNLIARLSNGVPEGALTPGACFSFDGAYVLYGSEDRRLHAFNVASLQEVAVLQQEHTIPPLALRWAPRRMLIASACTALSLWIPNMDTLQRHHQAAQQQLLAQQQPQQQHPQHPQQHQHQHQQAGLQQPPHQPGQPQDPGSGWGSAATGYAQ